MSVDLVVSAYKADLDWLKQVKCDRLYVYDKSEPGPGLFGKLWWGRNTRNAIHMPNVGKLDHTFCHHIVERYDDLADWTVFAPDNAPFKLKTDQSVTDVLIPGDSVKIPHLFTMREWGLDGKLQWDRWANRPDRNGTNWTERYYGGQITHARLSFVEWAKRYVGFDPSSEDWPGYAPGSIFGVPKKAITYLPKGFYERLREQLSHYKEPEEGHYLERLWLVIWTGKARYLDLPTSEVFPDKQETFSKEMSHA